MDNHAFTSHTPSMHTSKDKKPVIITTKSPLSLAISHFLKHPKQVKEGFKQRGATYLRDLSYESSSSLTTKQQQQQQPVSKPETSFLQQHQQ
jgi:hypothetical protein